MNSSHSHNHDQQYLDDLRHSCAHLLAAAVMEIWPDAHRTIGPTIENGFYFDFQFKEPISEKDFPKIENKMRQIIKKWHDFQRQEYSPDQAKAEYPGNIFKAELIDELAAKGEVISFYKSGEYTDLCRGGHVEDAAKELKYFKLLSLAGAYWRGDEKNPMLTRIYGTAFPSQEELDEYLWQKEEVKKRDHKKIGREQELFLISPSVGSGFPLYQPKGLLLRRALENWLIEEKEKRGFKFVWTPHVAKSDLYIQSGHWQKYDAMFKPMLLDEEEYVVKPMNCPHHFQLYNSRPRSYKEFPLILAENATVYRNEKAGELNGLFRVRALTQDDTHAFVRHADIANQIDKLLDLTFYVYETFGFADFKARISIRDPKSPDKYMGDPKTWDKAEAALIEAVKSRGVEYYVGEGEAAFYGPKIDVMVKDALGREWQLTTVQLDFVQPENFDMKYVNEEGKEERPAVLHVAILGSIDRFLGILIEHYAGAFPLWLSPVQVVVIPIAEGHLSGAQALLNELSKHHFRAEIDSRSDRLPAKIRDAQLQKVPYTVVMGDKEIADGSVTIRARGSQEQKTMSQLEFIQLLESERADKK
jgi:threonyl-tRNA synthetase